MDRSNPSELDLLDRKAVFEYLATEKPDAVVIAAAKVGGIHANDTYPVDFLTENLQIEANLMDGAHAAKIEKLLFLGSSCVYPKIALQPIKEEYLLTGELEKTNEAYALAKISGLNLSRHIENSMVTNGSQPCPQICMDQGTTSIYRTLTFYLRLSVNFTMPRLKEVLQSTLWGTGSPQREFLHSDDLGRACVFLLEHYNDDVAINVGVGEDIAIKDLAELIKRVVGFEGEIDWDSSKPDGTPRKLLDVSRIESLGWKATISLEDGIRSTYEWFKANNK
jgi:GDP-L-fucose synthase